MKISQVKKLTPPQRFLYWIKEREAIRRHKEAGTPQSGWTADEILATYRFCNVRRMDDKVSRWLDRYWFRQYKDHPNMLGGVALGRFFNKPETLAAIQPYVFKDGEINYEELIREARRLRDTGVAIFNGAYMVRGNDGMDKVDCVVDYYVKPMVKTIKSLTTDRMETAWEQLTACYGYGSFMAGQIVADLRWAMSGEWDDRNTWAPVGPGSARGLARLLYAKEDYKNVVKDYTSHEDVWLADFVEYVMEKVPQELPEEITCRLEAHDYQNCLCEFDKYERALWEEGKPKQLYKPGVK